MTETRACSDCGKRLNRYNDGPDCHACRVGKGFEPESDPGRVLPGKRDLAAAMELQLSGYQRR